MNKKRKLFNELIDGVESIPQQRTGKITLRTHKIGELPPYYFNHDIKNNDTK